MRDTDKDVPKDSVILKTVTDMRRLEDTLEAFLLSGGNENLFKGVSSSVAGVIISLEDLKSVFDRL